MNRAVVLFVLLPLSCVGCAKGTHGNGAQVQGAQSTWPESDKDAVRRQVEDHLLVDPSMAGLEDFIVEIAVIMNPDGSVQSARIDSSRDNGHPNWKLFANECLRAALRASPLKMPPDKRYGPGRP
jgi:hypothetical protein